MMSKRILMLAGVAAAILLLFSLSDRFASATTFSAKLQMSLSGHATNSTVASHYEIGGPGLTDANFGRVDTFIMGPEWGYVGSDDDVPDGTLIGHITTDTRLGLMNGGCFQPMSVEFDFLDSTTDTGATIDWDDDLGGNNLIEDRVGPGCTGSPDGLPDYTTCYPSFLNQIFDPDGPGGSGCNGNDCPPLRPRARLTGHQTVLSDSPSTLLFFLVFNPGDLEALSEPEASMGETLGYSTFVILNNPIAGGAAPTAITDFCTPLATDTDNFGYSRGVVDLETYDAISGLYVSGEMPFETPSECGDPGDDPDGDGILQEGCLRFEDCGAAPGYSGNGSDETPNNTYGIDASCGTAMLINPGAGTGIYGSDTHLMRAYSQALRDFDGDGFENQLDPCALTTDAGDDPRAVSNPADSDGDGLQDSCDPVPGTSSTPAHADCGATAALPDEDQDCWPNRSDNCPLVKNGWENGAECDEAAPGTPVADDDNDGVYNDGCPMEGDYADCDSNQDEDCDDAGEAALCDNQVDDDGDTIYNDGCPGAAAQVDDDEPMGAATHDYGPNDDGIGDLCEPDWDGDTVSDPEEAGLSPTTADGHYHQLLTISALCLTAAWGGSGTDSDGDGWCDDLEDFLGSDPNDDPNPSTPEGIAIDYAVPVTSPAEQTCDDGVDNDDDGVIDGADGLCTAMAEDSDADGVPETYPCASVTAGSAGGSAQTVAAKQVHVGKTADDLCIVCPNAAGLNSGSVTVNAPGCAAPTSVVAGTNGNGEQVVEVQWGSKCVDAGESVTVQFNATTAPAGGCWVVWSDPGTPVIVDNSNEKNPDQADFDGDTVGDESDPDNDDDIPAGTFTDVKERYIGTSTYDDCADTATANDEVDDRWPLDQDDNQKADTSDVLAYAGLVAPPTYPAGAGWTERKDLNMDGKLDTSDVLQYAGLVAPPTYC